MSFGRDNDGLPGQSGRGGSHNSGSGFPGLPREAQPRKKMPGGKAGGGGMLMLLIIGAIVFFMMKRPPANRPAGPDNGVEQPVENSGQPWRPDPNRRVEQPKNDGNKIDIPGVGSSKDKSDRVENEDGWSMEDAKKGGSKDKGSQFPFSNQKKKEDSDKVETEDGWQMKDATEKNKKRDR